MNYEMLEAALVTKIADLRKAEQTFERTLDAVKNGISMDLNAAHRRLHAHMREVERLMAQMDSTPAYATMPVAAMAQTAPLAVA